jgi:ATP-dependent DNA helicase RecG
MLSKEELVALLNNPNAEQDRIEFTVTTKDTDKFSEAICAFANDFPNHKKAGYLLIGVDKNGSLAGLVVTDELQKDIAAIRNNGQILPQPSLSLATFSFPEGEVLVVEVQPAFHPPVRYKGKICIRVGATKGYANEAEERILIERRTAQARTFDALPSWEANIDDLATAIIQLSYLPLAIDSETLALNHRDFKQQLASLRLYDLKHDKPTNAGILLFGLNPTYFLAGAYIQYLKIDGTEKGDFDKTETKEFKGALFDVLKQIDDYLKNMVIKERTMPIEGSFRDKTVYNYPYFAVRELVMNAIMHRDYQANAPIYIYEFLDRIEIRNAGGLYGMVTPQTFPEANDYRNPILAEAMKTLGYVNRFNYGIKRTQELLLKNGNPPANFDISSTMQFVVTLTIEPSWQPKE